MIISYLVHKFKREPRSQKRISFIKELKDQGNPAILFCSLVCSKNEQVFMHSISINGTNLHIVRCALVHIDDKIIYALPAITNGVVPELFHY